MSSPRAPLIIGCKKWPPLLSLDQRVTLLQDLRLIETWDLLVLEARDFTSGIGICRQFLLGQTKWDWVHLYYAWNCMSRGPILKQVYIIVSQQHTISPRRVLSIFARIFIKGISGWKLYSLSIIITCIIKITPSEKNTIFFQLVSVMMDSE